MVNNLVVELVVMLAMAIIVLMFFRRCGIPPILGYLATGLIVGPGGLAVVSDPEDIQFAAELGVVFLLFSLGLEFSLPKLNAMRRLVFGLGSGQVFITGALIYGFALLMGVSSQEAFVLAAAATLSSTAIVIKQLTEMGKTNSMAGQMTVSTLLFQDLAVVPMLIIIPMLSSSGEPLGMSLLWALVKGIGAFVILLSAGKWLLPRLFDEIASARSDELFVLTTLLVVVLTGGLTHSLGLSAALGAFLAGMMLGESQYRHQLEADIRPFRDILMGLFFISIGMMLELKMLLEYGAVLLILLPLLIVVKVAVIFMLFYSRPARWRASLKTGLYLAQMGEFGFVVLALAKHHQVVDADLATLMIALGVLSMALTPILIHFSEDIAKFLLRKGRPAPTTFPTPEVETDLSEHVVICGFGRVGQTVARFLKTEAIPYLALDCDPVRIHETQIGGEQVIFGDGRNRDILKALGVERAKLVIITFTDTHSTMQLLSACKHLSENVRVLVRTRDDSEMNEYKEAGAMAVVPESLEGSLMLVSQVLYMSGVPMSRVLKRIQTERHNHYQCMHGFFHGDESSNAMNVDLEQLHAVSLPQRAHAVGKTIADLPLDRLRIDLRGVRRNRREMPDPKPDLILESNDVLILCGKPRRVERAESYLLDGS